MEKKQNSIDWLVNVVQSCIAPNYIPQEIIKQAKAMHKEEIINSYEDGHLMGSSNLENTGKQHYYETFEGNNE